MTKLSPNFTLEELTRSEVAARNDIDMSPDADVYFNLARLATDVLEPIRSAIGDRAIFVSSGYRPPALNSIVNGSKTSDHFDGRAADITAAGMTVRELGEKIRTIKSIPLKQCIEEFGSWIHVSIAPVGTAAKREFLMARREGGETVYKQWA